VQWSTALLRASPGFWQRPLVHVVPVVSPASPASEEEVSQALPGQTPSVPTRGARGSPSTAPTNLSPAASGLVLPEKLDNVQ